MKHSAFLKLVIVFFLFTTLQSGGCKKDEVENPIIGTTGPAGGVIFYDKGSYSNGWRYLEMAPQDASTNDLIFGCDSITIPSVKDKRSIGLGKQNTQNIINFQNSSANNCYNSTQISAAKACDNFIYNGYDDWFLPSSDELKVMIDVWNYHLVGGLMGNRWYWSSTEAMYNAWGIALNPSLNNNNYTSPGNSSFPISYKVKSLGFRVRPVRSY